MNLNSNLINPLNPIIFKIKKFKSLITEDQYLKFFKDHNMYSYRDKYVREIAWFLLTEKNIKLLSSLMKGKKVLSLAAGMGYAEKWIMKLNPDINIKITDKGDSNYFIKSLPEWIEKIDALDALKKYKNWYDIVFLAWPPYKDSLAYDVLQKMKKNSKLIIIGEGIGGCVANDDFWEEIEDKNKYKVKEIYNFDSFSFISDYITIIEKF